MVTLNPSLYCPYSKEYELVKLFAKKYNLRVEIIVPPKREDLLTWLLNGKGDIIAASITKNSLNSDKVSYSEKYNIVTEDIVMRNNDKIESPKDLKDRTFYIRRSSSYYNTLKKYKFVN